MPFIEVFFIAGGCCQSVLSESVLSESVLSESVLSG